MNNELDDRLRIMRELDIYSAMALFPKCSPNTNKEMLLMMLHKSRYECVLIERDLRLESYWYLKSHGLKRIGGADLLPNGELPE